VALPCREQAAAAVRGDHLHLPSRQCGDADLGRAAARQNSGQGTGDSLTAACIVAGRYAERWGTKPLFLVGFSVLAARGALYTFSNDPWWLVGVQALDGVGAGIFGALFPVVIADLTKGLGRFNVSQGAVATAQGLGAALSASLAGAIIVAAGYSVSFLTLAAIAAGGFVLYLIAMPETKTS
jgi:MFS family permease